MPIACFIAGVTRWTLARPACNALLVDFKHNVCSRLRSRTGVAGHRPDVLHAALRYVGDRVFRLAGYASDHSMPLMDNVR